MWIKCTDSVVEQRGADRPNEQRGPSDDGALPLGGPSAEAPPGAGAPRLDKDGEKREEELNQKRAECGLPPKRWPEGWGRGKSKDLNEMTRRGARVYQRCMSFLSVWLFRKMRILWVTLTTAPGGEPRKMAYRHKLLLSRVASQLKYRNVEYFYVRTGEGNGVLHALWAWRPAKGENRIFYIPREWLHEAWRELHGAPITKVKKFRKDAHEGRRMARYLMTQYVAGQGALQHSGGG